MLEYSLVQTRGFANVVENGTVTGFRLLVRAPNYRGAWGALIDGIDISVDGHAFPKESVSWTLNGQTYTQAELSASSNVHWGLETPASVFVPHAGGLKPGVHDLHVVVYLRSPYIPAFALPLKFPERCKRTIVPAGMGDKPGFKYGVSLYSYTGDMNTVMTLDDALADIADMGATGFEILSQSTIPGYPDPSPAWIESWHRMVQASGLTPTNVSSWVDTQMWKDRDLTLDEAVAQLTHDLRLSAELGFTFIRPKFGVTSPELDPHPLWRDAVLRVLDLAHTLNVVICPEIHSPTPIRHRVTENYVKFIDETKTENFKLMIDTGIFQTVASDEHHLGFEKGAKRPAFLEPLKVPMEDLVAVMPYVGFIQSKFFEITDTLQDLNIPWREILQTLIDTKYTGWLSSEYEGRREPYRGREQVRRHHALLRTMTEELTAG